MMAEVNESAIQNFLAQTSEAVEELSDCLPWHQNARRRSLKQLTREGLPSIRNEFWKYSRVRKFLPSLLRPDGSDETPVTTRPNRIEQPVTEIPNCHRVEVNGTDISRNDLPAGLVIEAFSEDNRNYVEQELNQNIDTSRYPLALLNDALLQNGILIRVLRGHHIELPLNLIVRTQPSKNLWEASRLLILLEPESQLTVIEQHTECPHWLNRVRECSLAESSQLHLSLIHPPHNNSHWNLTTARLHKQAQMKLQLACFGGQFQRNEINLKLVGEQADASLHCMLHGQGKERIDTQVNMEHIAVDTTSRQQVRSMAAERSEITFNGRIHIHKGAQRTDARLSNANLILNDGARINTKPELEIYADDVQCAHGATVGQLDQNQIFYLRSRGLSELEARKLLTLAFMRSSMQDDTLQTVIEDMLEGRNAE